MNFTKEEIEALMKCLGGGAVINLTDCQIVLGDMPSWAIFVRRSMLMLRQLQTSRLLIRNSRRRKPKPFSESQRKMDISIQKTLLMFGAYLRQSMVIWSILFQTFWISSILHPIEFCGRYLEAFFLMLRVWRKRRRQQ